MIEPMKLVKIGESGWRTRFRKQMDSPEERHEGHEGEDDCKDDE